MSRLAALRRRERIIAVVRWVAVIFAVTQAAFYEPSDPSLAEAAATARSFAFMLAGALAGVGIAVEVALRVLRTTGALSRAGLTFLVLDVVITVGFLYAFAFDPASAHWAMLTVLPIEGALRFNVAGALGVWAVIAPAYLFRDAVLTPSPLLLGLVGYRMGLVLVIAAFAGFAMRDLEQQRRVLQALADGSRRLMGRPEVAEILQVLCREVVRCLDARSAVVYVHDGEWFQAVAGSPSADLPTVLEQDQEEHRDPLLEQLVLTAPVWLEADELRPARLAVPLQGAERPVSHVLVVRPRGQRLSDVEIDAAAALAEAAGLALASARALTNEQRTTRELRYLEALRTRFVATIAHDLRLPLTVFKGVAQLLRTQRESIDPSEIDEMLGSVERQANRLSRLADDLLDAARMDAERFSLQAEPCDLRSVIAATTADSEEDVEVETDGDLTLVADSGRLERMLWNLLSNAEKYGKPPFEITARREDDDVVLAVRDHGSGVSAEQQQRLFEDFAGSGGPASVGLGLAIVQRLAAAHGGDVTYEDAEPGARFVVRLPVEGPEAGEPGPEPDDPDEPEPTEAELPAADAQPRPTRRPAVP